VNNRSSAEVAREIRHGHQSHQAKGQINAMINKGLGRAKYQLLFQYILTTKVLRQIQKQVISPHFDEISEMFFSGNITKTRPRQNIFMPL
jgi:hypothetical protein